MSETTDAMLDLRVREDAPERVGEIAMGEGPVPGILDPDPAVEVDMVEPTDAETETPRAAREGREREDRYASPSGITTYFRQIGRRSEPMSREQETALAQRIEAAQEAHLAGLCSIPMLVERIAQWCCDVREERLRVRELIEIATSGEASDGATEGEQALSPGVAAQLKAISKIAAEIASLIRIRMAGLARGRDLGKVRGARLAQLFAKFRGEVERLRLRAERLDDLVAALERELAALGEIERELARTDRGGARTRAESARATTLRGELAAFVGRIGLPVAEFRDRAAEIGKARRAIVRGREELVRAHLPLVIAIARRYRRNGSMDLLDLIQEGNMGLMHAIEKFDHRRGVKVSTYAVWWIRQSIARALADQGRTIRIPVHMAEIAGRVLRDRRKIYQEKGHEPSVDEIAARTGIAPARIAQVLAMVQQPTSLDLPIGEDGDATLGDLIAAPDAVNPHTAAEASSLRDVVLEAVSGLTPREERILRMRFGLGGSSEHTLEEVGEIFGVTRERIRQIEARALEKLRNPAQAARLATFAHG